MSNSKPTSDTPKDDILVSVCFSDASYSVTACEQIATLAKSMKSNFRYWEILIVNEIGQESEFEGMLLALPNLRYISVVHGLDSIQRRVVGASEAIGDIVVITSIHELPSMDIPAMIHNAHTNGSVILGQRNSAALVEPLIALLGRASGFRASTRDMQSVAIPRTVLNRLLRDTNPILALRFPPRDNTIKVSYCSPHFSISARAFKQEGSSRLSTRFDLLKRMVIEAGPSILDLIALLSVLMLMGGFFFTLYVVIVYLSDASVTRGWTTLSLAICGLVVFLSTALFGICITLRKLVEIIGATSKDYILSEKSSVDLFNSVANALNIEITTSSSSGVKDGDTASDVQAPT